MSAAVLMSEVPSMESQVSEEIHEEQEIITTYTDIDALQDHGIGQAELNKLRTAGIHTVKSLQQATEKSLLDIKGFSTAKVEKVQAAADKVENSSFQTATLELQRRQEHIVRISTGVTEVDKMLGGGFDTQAITELHGEWRTGKTQLCHTLCLTAQMPNEESNYGGGKIVYFDSEGTFRPERLKGIADRFEMDYEAALENIYHVRCLNTDHMMRSVNKLAELIMENDGQIKLVIVDSIMAQFRTDYKGRGELAPRQQMLGQFLRTVHKLAEEFNFAAVLTNQMTSDPGGGMTFVSDPKKPIGGHVLAHAVQTRVMLRKGQGEDRVCKLVDSPMMPLSEATFTITNGGCVDSK